MPGISFTANIQRHVECPEAEVAGRSAREALDAYFKLNPMARSYVLDDQGALRKHIAVFVDGKTVRDRAGLSDPVGAASRLHVYQALSGG